VKCKCGYRRDNREKEIGKREDFCPNVYNEEIKCKPEEKRCKK
jgi:hypothetical protein